MKLFLSSLFKVFGIILIVSTNTFGQFKEVDSIHKVVFKPFSPPVKAVIEDLLYTEAQVFLAPDIYGDSHNLLNYRDKIVLLWFWNTESQISIEGLNALKELKNSFGNKIEVFTFANENKKELLEYFEGKEINYYVMFNSNIFAEMMYAGSLGFPRLFVINHEGIIVKILPQEYFEQTIDLNKDLHKIVDDIQQK